MGWLTRRETPHGLFEDGLRWVEAIKHHEVDAEAFAIWAMQSAQRMEAFAQAWRIWHDLCGLSSEQLQRIEEMARVLRGQRGKSRMQ